MMNVNKVERNYNDKIPELSVQIAYLEKLRELT